MWLVLQKEFDIIYVSEIRAIAISVMGKVL